LKPSGRGVEFLIGAQAGVAAAIDYRPVRNGLFAQFFPFFLFHHQGVVLLKGDMSATTGRWSRLSFHLNVGFLRLVMASCVSQVGKQAVPYIPVNIDVAVHQRLAGHSCAAQVGVIFASYPA
jgi:hypothetical protein